MSEEEQQLSVDSAFRRKAMRRVIIAQSCGCWGQLAFRNGMLLLYLTAQGIDPARILVYLSLGTLVSGLTLLPLAYLSDRVGKKRVGYVGQLVCAAGLAIIACSGWMGGLMEAATAVGMVAFWLGQTMYASGWFALLSPIVPAGERGRFFAKLRISWNTVGIAFAACCSFFLSKDTALIVFQIILFVVTGAILVRIYFYQQIPELEPARPKEGSVVEIIGTILRSNGYASFISYVFLLTLFTAGVPTLFGLIEKEVIDLGDKQVLWLANVTIVGMLAGFFLSGKAVDRWGTKVVFVACHFSYGGVLLLYLCRVFCPSMIVLLVFVGALHLCFGASMGASSVCLSTEMLALIPSENKSLSTAICNTLMQLGAALSGLICAWALKLGVLSESWTLFNREMSSYDALLLAYGGMVVLSVVTLGLVPAVLRKAEWVPRGQ